jgi:DNA polymerase III alpha subunit
MRTNSLHQVVIDEDDVLEVLYRNDTIKQIIVEQGYWAERFNKHCREFELPFLFDWQEESSQSEEEFIRSNLLDWNLPAEYNDFDLENYLLSKCETTEQVVRVQQELEEFRKRDMLGVLTWLKYFIDTLRANDKVWGVGRGSSVSSYVLYLLDIHRVDSLKYELDIKEFLK